MVGDAGVRAARLLSPHDDHESRCTTYKAQGGDEALGRLEVGKTTAAVDWSEPARGYGGGATYALGCSNDEGETRTIFCPWCINKRSSELSLTRRSGLAAPELYARTN
jgi:hypothetical protein